MFGLNRAEVIGRLGADVTVNHLTTGGRVANMSIATDESYVDRDDHVVVVDLDEIRLILAGEGNAGRAVRLVANDQVELGQAVFGLRLLDHG